MASKNREWENRPENKSHVLNYKRMWRVDNPEKARAIDKRYRDKNKASRNKHSRDYYKKTREKQLAQAKARYKKNGEKIKAAAKQKRREIKLQKVIEGKEWKNRVDEFYRGSGGKRMTWHISAGGRIRCFIDGQEVDLTK